MFKNQHLGRRSDSDLARPSMDSTRTRALAHTRSSEQIPRSSNTPSSPQPPPSRRGLAPPPAIFEGKSVPRFSLLRFRNASDSAIGLRARDPNPPALPTHAELTATPSIITTSPTGNFSNSHSPLNRSNTKRLWRARTPEKPGTANSEVSQRSSLSNPRRRDQTPTRAVSSSVRMSRVTFDERERPHNLTAPSITGEPPPYDDQNMSLPIPAPRLSESSRSTASSAEHIAYATTTTTHTTTTTTFFKLPRRRRKDAPLFPLPDKTPTETHFPPTVSETDLIRPGKPMSASGARSIPSTPNRQMGTNSHTLAPSALTGQSPTIMRSNSNASARSAHSSPSQTPRSGQLRRGRSSTLSSLDQNGERSIVPRNSFGGLLGRIRKDSDLASTLSRNASPQPYSRNSSLAVSQERVAIPARGDGDTPQMYLSKLFEAVSKSVVAALLARNADAFHIAVLKAYMTTFQFMNDPMDMALRKLLMEVELPSETQQIDRVLQAFADRYHECNPFIYGDSDQAYYVAFSLIMLHTDVFNKNNKHKMQKADYIKNTSGALSEGIANDILECFYHNITYTPFIRMEDEFDINGEKIVSHRPKRSLFGRSYNDGKRIKEPVDPYTIIIDDQLDMLRPNLKDVVQIEDPYSYTGTASRLEIQNLHKAFFHSGVLQILSVRSRPDAFLSQTTLDNPDGADPGVVEIKVTKVGVLWRKEMKKKKTRSPWHEWGAILTGSQLYFFRNLAWIKQLIQQYEVHHKHGAGTPVIFKPPLDQFKPDAQVSTDDAVALLDKNYKKHKNAFAFVRHGGMQEYFIADSESEMNDWLAKLNYAATFRTAGVRMRGVVGGNYEGQRSRGIRRMETVTSSPSTHSVQTPSGEVSIIRGGIDSKLAAEIAAARREVIQHKIADSEDRLATANRQLQIHLRNARHLTILAPIQPRAREQVVLAAGNLAAKLQWVRMEMWKLKCHRDILALDMEEERKAMREQARRVLSVCTPIRGASARPSPAASVQGSPTSPISGEQTPTQATFSPTLSVGEELTKVSSNPQSHKRIPSLEIPPVGVDRNTDRSHRGSISSVAPRSPSSTSLMPQRTEVSLNATDDISIETARSYRSQTPTRSESSFGDPEKEEDEKKDKGKGKEKESSRPKIRRSLQRTLRETQALGHRRGKSKDTSTEDGAQVDKKHATETEGLARSSGSFTVHGKKASVITFGSEWQTMSAEDRLRRSKQSICVTEGDATMDSEALANLQLLSRKVSLANGHRRDEDGLCVPPPASRRGSHTTHHMSKDDEQLPEVPENSTMESAAEASLLSKLNGVHEEEKKTVSRQSSTSTQK
ncbi:hypothetical protein RUND412_008308 [Rhizina undulata]